MVDRDACSRSSACQMYSAALLPGVRDGQKTSLFARSNTWRNFSGGLPISAESNPTAMIASRWGSARSRVAIAASSLRSRRKQRINRSEALGMSPSANAH